MSIFSNDSNALWLIQWESFVSILEQDSGCSSDFSNKSRVVILNVDVFVDNGIIQICFWILVAVGIQCPRIEVDWDLGSVSSDLEKYYS